MASSTRTAVRMRNRSNSTIMLHEWWLVKKDRGRIGVGGIASMGMREERESVFLSTPITKRYEANVVETEDGITLILRGFINASRSSLNGFPSHISQHFLLGFPFHWIQFVNDNQFNARNNATTTTTTTRNNSNSNKKVSLTTTPQLPL